MNEYEIGRRLWALKYNQDFKQLKVLVDYFVRLMGVVFKKFKGAHEVVLLVLAHFCDDRCDICGGRGHAVVPGTDRLAREDCGGCRGQGRIALPDTSGEARWLQRKVESLAAMAAMSG